ncbi:MAG: AAA family ATPase [Bacteroidetes bacterium 4572_77]|nr:MAG: AAA family ATPase [Bacteroidetes bacterium 4572_77]
MLKKLIFEKYIELKKEIAKVIIGQDEVVRDVIMAVFSKGHALLVGVPGLAKTLLVNTIAQSLGLSYKRIQFTPDLMPSDIIGAEILNDKREFKFVQGPIFSNIMPEAQLDRFMFNIILDYPSYEEEIEVVKATTGLSQTKLNTILTAEEILFFQDLIRKIPVIDNVYEYAVSLVAKTRPNTAKALNITNDYISWGAGPRASQYLIIGAKCHAAIKGKYSPDIEDVKAIAPQILRHRLVRNYKAVAEGVSMEHIISELL